MFEHRHRGLSRRASSLLLAVVVWTASAGCTGSVVTTGTTDGGADGAGSGGDATAGCSPSACAGMPAPALAKVCPDGTSLGATLCVPQGAGCAWGFPACPADAGQQCPALGCLPACPNGVLKDMNGCDTCQCASGSDAGTDSGGACASQRGGPCGGNTARPCACASGLACTPGDSGLPFGDVGGTCQ